MSTYRIGIDAGGTKVAYGLFDEENRLLKAVQQAVLLVKQAVGHLGASGVDADAIGAHRALSSSA